MVAPVSNRTGFIQSAMSTITVRERLDYDEGAVEEAAQNRREMMELAEQENSQLEEAERLNPPGIGENVDFYA